MIDRLWVPLDVDYFTNPKAIAAGVYGRQLHLASICWSKRHRTDGEIPRHAADAILRLAGVPRSAIGNVVDSGLWLAHESGWTVHDYLEMNRSRGQIAAAREANRERQRKFRDRQRNASHELDGDA